MYVKSSREAAGRPFKSAAHRQASDPGPSMDSPHVPPIVLVVLAG